MSCTLAGQWVLDCTGGCRRLETWAGTWPCPGKWLSPTCRAVNVLLELVCSHSLQNRPADNMSSGLHGNEYRILLEISCGPGTSLWKNYCHEMVFSTTEDGSQYWKCWKLLQRVRKQPAKGLRDSNKAKAMYPLSLFWLQSFLDGCQALSSGLQWRDLGRICSLVQ